MIRTRITYWNLTRLTIFFVISIGMFDTFIPLWEVFEFFSVNCHFMVVLGIQIDDMDRFTVLTKVFLTGITIVFGVPWT